MKNKKKCFIILFIVIFICIGLIFIFNNKNKDESNNNDELINNLEYDFDEYDLNWKDLVSISFFGVEGNSFYTLTYLNIPDIDNRISKVEELWEENKSSIVDNNINSESIFEEVNTLLNVKDENYCYIKEDTSNLKNGDIITVNCDNESLKKLGYTFEPTFTIEVNGLGENIDDVSNNEIEDTNDKSTSETIDIKEDLFIYDDNVVLITPSNLDNFEIKGDYSDKEVTMFVHSKEDLNKAIKYALKNNNIDIIQYNGKEYLKEDNFSEGREWKGRVGE